MEIKHLDLCEAGCPMALLLAKRALVSLAADQQLLMDACDSGTIKDISNYLHSLGFNVITTKFNTKTRFVVTL